MSLAARITTADDLWVPDERSRHECFAPRRGR